jgi:hypothetical protein
MCVKVSTASKKFGTFTKNKKKTFTFQENTNPTEENTKDIHGRGADNYCGLKWFCI